MYIRKSVEMLRHLAWPPPIGFRSLRRHFVARHRFWQSLQRYRALAAFDGQPETKYLFPCLGDDTVETPIDASYYYQDAWAFERIYNARPDQHIDVGSHHKFVSLLSKVVSTTMVDLRPLPVQLDSLKFVEGSILSLPFADATIPSVSSLCVIEHIGLGRYGDPLDPEGSVKALRELMRIVQPAGNLYISVPIDDCNRIYFNAHRAFREDYLLKLFTPFEVLDSRYIYNGEFGDHLKSAFGTGCYHLRAPVHT